MGHPTIHNRTPFYLDTLYVTDENHRPLIVPVMKATFDLQPDGRVTRALEQNPLCPEGEYYGDPSHSSYRYEPEVAFIKPNTDVVVIGDIVAPHDNCTQLLVDIQVGVLQKQLMVFGDRYWLRQGEQIKMSAPQPFQRIPLQYEYAFGGWDKRHPDPQQHDFEPRNTVGKGFYTHAPQPDEYLPLPNIEDPSQLIQQFAQRVPPAGTGFTLPHWQPRAVLAGTYDAQWQQQRCPLLPTDFNRRYFNSASNGLIANGYFKGGEQVALTHLSEQGPLQFQLPYLQFNAQLDTHQDSQSLPFALDTIIINTQTRQLFMLWRCHCLLPDYQAVQQLEVSLG